MSQRSSDHEDNDPTDELPILLEAVALDELSEAAFAAPRAETTAEHEILYAPTAPEERPSSAELEERAARIAGLEAELRTKAERVGELEHAHCTA